ncbi:DNA sulfur modification protein DndB [Neobacillus sp. SM06]|uniref:DNA sulfur modification protein DndB n=1 Tax=Neobacillus sp. SM06 TaxID=3422492 RepID=UPI003D2DB165
MELLTSDIRTTIKGNGYNQFGKRVLITQLRFSTLEAIFEVDPEVQRSLDPKRRSEIREFIMDALEHKDFYFSPFVFSARGAIKETQYGWELDPGCKLYIIDGQHRSSAMSSALSHLKSRKESAEESGNLEEANKIQIYIDKLRNYPVSMQVYLNLTQQEERQLFTDINTERKDAHIGLVMQYDQRDEYTELSRQVANQLQSQFEIEQKLSRLTMQNTALTSLINIRKCLIALFEGKLSEKKGAPYFRNCNPNDVPKISLSFFESWQKLFPPQMANRKRFVSGLTGIQVALAYTVYLLTKKDTTSHLEAIHHVMMLKNYCTWKHDDPLFSHIYDPATGKIKNHSTTTAIETTAMNFINILDRERLI